MAYGSRRLKRVIAIVLGSYVLGLAGVILGVALWDSRGVTGIAILWLTAVVVYAWQTFRCPLCGASIFNGPAGAALLWLFREPRRCPRCATDYESARIEMGRVRGKVQG
ncbi:MAG: hypothetical protein L0271_24755 [Gemmatimonadetes bacterium]|nr:hypothetical protein [Gemmatimonadota bacterium]